MPSTDLELLTVGRISIDLYCDQLGAARLGRRAAIVTKVAAAARLLERGVRLAIVKLGGDGAWAFERSVAFASAAGGFLASRVLCSQAMPFEHEVLEQLGQDLQNAGEVRVWNG